MAAKVRFNQQAEIKFRLRKVKEEVNENTDK
jgi:hypothetical protein